MMRIRTLLLLGALFLMPLAANAQMNVAWETLGQVKLVKADGQFVPEFEAAVQQLEGQQVRLKGFMLPLDQASKQQHFILSANPVANCFFCMPGGPESLVEIKADKAVEFSYDPIEISGTLELLQDDPMGMYYRITSAKINS
jgi:hypothetical protein